MGPLHTLHHPRLSDLAARSFFVGREGHLPPTASLEAARAGARNSLLRHLAARRGGVLSDADELAVAREECQHGRPECVAWLVRLRSRPAKTENPEIRALVEALTHERSDGGPAVPPTVLEEVARFESDATVAAGVVDPASAARTTDVFRDYYTHALPFRRSALKAIWDACESADAARCTRPREEAERLLGDLGTEVDGPSVR